MPKSRHPLGGIAVLQPPLIVSLLSKLLVLVLELCAGKMIVMFRGYKSGSSEDIQHALSVSFASRASIEMDPIKPTSFCVLVSCSLYSSSAVNIVSTNKDLLLVR